MSWNIIDTKVKHKRKVSALTKDLSKATHRRNISPHMSMVRMKTPGRSHSYHEFQEETENGDSHTIRTQNTQQDVSPSSKKRKKIIGEFSVASSEFVKSTSVDTKNISSGNNQADFKSTFGNIK